jgi:hypothetical protein
MELTSTYRDNKFLSQKKIIDTPIVKHPTATQGLKRSPISAIKWESTRMSDSWSHLKLPKIYNEMFSILIFFFMVYMC